MYIFTQKFLLSRRWRVWNLLHPKPTDRSELPSTLLRKFLNRQSLKGLKAACEERKERLVISLPSSSSFSRRWERGRKMGKRLWRSISKQQFFGIFDPKTFEFASTTKTKLIELSETSIFVKSTSFYDHLSKSYAGTIVFPRFGAHFRPVVIQTALAISQIEPRICPLTHEVLRPCRSDPCNKIFGPWQGPIDRVLTLSKNPS